MAVQTLLSFTQSAISLTRSSRPTNSLAQLDMRLTAKITTDVDQMDGEQWHKDGGSVLLTPPPSDVGSMSPVSDDGSYDVDTCPEVKKTSKLEEVGLYFISS